MRKDNSTKKVEINSVYRNEVKYLVSKIDFYKMKFLLNAYLEVDKNNGDNGYKVRSLYFDSYYDDDLFDVINGYNDKSKIRLRYYMNNHENFKLELKKKFNNSTIKESINLNYEEASKLINGEYSFLNLKNELSCRIYLKMIMHVYKPKILIDYTRNAYVSNLNNIRVTFDYDFSSSLTFDNFFDMNYSSNRLSDDSMGLLEIKYTDFLPTYIKDILVKFDISPTSNSKYSIGRLLNNFQD